ncbi:MAG: tail fiber domain-containing protein, partial [Trichloromonas sp.]|nr:tail fiber domain-containing protein [Trichloromonas sp.]
TNPGHTVHIVNKREGAALRGESTYSSGIHYGGAFTANTGTVGYGCYAAGSQYDFFAGGAGIDYGSSSSIRWKDNIVEIENAIDKIMKMRGVYFDWDNAHGGSHDIGFIAEEVAEVIPEIVSMDPEDNDFAVGLDYGALTPLLLQSIKEQQQQIEAQQQQIDELKAMVEKLMMNQED